MDEPVNARPRPPLCRNIAPQGDIGGNPVGLISLQWQISRRALEKISRVRPSDQKFGVFPETDGNSGDSETRDAELLDLIM